MMAVPVWARYMAEAGAGWPHGEVPVEVPEGVSPNDRGGNRGKSADGPMPLAPHKKVKSTEALPAGVRVGPAR
jgi:hypothetical protein